MYFSSSLLFVLNESNAAGRHESHPAEYLRTICRRPSAAAFAIMSPTTRQPQGPGAPGTRRTGARMKMTKTFCNCRDVTYADIMAAMRAGATTAEEVSAATGAGTGCGRCREALDFVVRDFLEELEAEKDGSLPL